MRKAIPELGGFALWKRRCEVWRKAAQIAEALLRPKVRIRISEHFMDGLTPVRPRPKVLRIAASLPCFFSMATP
jgi:hypothetical protein